MARCGVQTLLCKYNNPTSYSNRILINNKSYYHPYVIYYYTQYGTLALCNTTKINKAKLEFDRCISYISFTYRTKDHTIILVRRIDNSISIFIKIYQPAVPPIYIEKPGPSVKFTLKGDPKFQIIADTIVETTLAEIYKNHLPAILSLIEV